MGAVARATQLEDSERLDPERLIADIQAMGKPAFYEPITDHIITTLQSLTHPGDVVVIFSNGSFDGLASRLQKDL